VKPEGDQLLRVLGGVMMTELAPGLTEDYLQRNAMMTGMLLAAVAEEWDRAAARRAEENASLRELFSSAAPSVAEPELERRLLAAAGASEGSLLVAALERENAALRALLIDLHEHVEGLGTDDARRIEAAIWEELRRSTERRRLSIAPF
jgi:hypothetical protein